jgi:carbonic anhydrase
MSHNSSGDWAPTESIWGDNPKQDLKEIFDNNIKWRKEMLDRDPNYFAKLSVGQKPRYLLVGCSDSRVGAQQVCDIPIAYYLMIRPVVTLCPIYMAHSHFFY